MDAEKIGRTISFLRKQAGMTQNELAQKLDVTDKAVSRWERGVGTPDISLLTKLASILDTDIEAVLEGNFTHKESECKGLLVMNYHEGICADTFLYTKRIVYFQLSFFLLAGVREICVRGRQKDVDFVHSELKDGEEYGARLHYEVVDKTCDINAQKSPYFLSTNKECSFLVIDGLSFVYGKDVTSFLKRLIFDSVTPVNVANYKKNQLFIKFFPIAGRKILADAQNKKCSQLMLGRGVIAFPIKNQRDLFDAGTIISIAEHQHGESFADLHEIAKSRGFI